MNTSVTNLTIPLTLAVSALIFIVGGMFSIDVRYAKAGDLKQSVYRQAIQNDRMWLEMLEIKLDKANTPEEKDRILRQIEMTQKSLEINMDRASEE